MRHRCGSRERRIGYSRSASFDLSGLAPCAAVSVVPQGLHRAAVAAGTGPASTSYDVDAATMQMERHERGIHALRPGAHEADVADARFRCAPQPTGDTRSRPRATEATRHWVITAPMSH